MFEKGSRQVGSFRFVISNYACLCYEVVEDDVCCTMTIQDLCEVKYGTIYWKS